MRNSIKTELTDYILDSINDGVINNENQEEWHHILFNQDYYIVYHSEAEIWLKNHGLSAFEAIEKVQEWEEFHFGETNTNINPERIVNMLVYIYGEELLPCVDTIEELEEELS